MRAPRYLTHRPYARRGGFKTFVRTDVAVLAKLNPGSVKPYAGCVRRASGSNQQMRAFGKALKFAFDAIDLDPVTATSFHADDLRSGNNRDAFLGEPETRLSQMLGIRRTTVTLVARGLQRAGLIKYRRGHITIEDREGLEEAACECYGSMKLYYARLIQ